MIHAHLTQENIAFHRVARSGKRRLDAQRQHVGVCVGGRHRQIGVCVIPACMQAIVTAHAYIRSILSCPGAADLQLLIPG